MTTAPVTIEQAAAILGVSASTIRRRIRAGAIQVEEARRPQGVVWLVHLPPGTAPAAEATTVDTGPVTTTATTGTPPADAMAALIQAALAPIVAPLVAEQAALRQVVERQAEQLVGKEQEIGTIREERGCLTAELEGARARLAELESPAESGRLDELARENGSLVERLAAQKRLREAAMAHAAELEAKLEAATARPPDPEPAPASLPEPIPPAPNVAPWWRHRLAPHAVAVLVALAIILALAAVPVPPWVR